MTRTKQKIEYGKKYYQENKETIIKNSKRRYSLKKKEILEKHRENHRKRKIEELLFERAKSRARRFNLPMNISKEDIIVPIHCPILGIKLKRNVGGKVGLSNSPSIDKIIPEKGYVKGNIQVISYKANVMKNNASMEELMKFAEWVFNINGYEYVNNL